MNLKNLALCSHSNTKEKYKIKSCNHDKSEYCLQCSCPDCSRYRRDLVVVAQDHFITAEMWSELKLIVRNLYKSIFGNISNNEFEQYFANNKNGWQSCGTLNHTKKVFSKRTFDLTDEMKLAFNVALLQAEDSHQLLELLSIDTSCLIRAYARGITNKFGESIDRDTALYKINYVINGYERIVVIAAKIESLIFGFQKNYLDNFYLSWTLLNKRLYQNLVYTKFSDVAIHYLSKLKKEVPPNLYIEILSKYLAFDDEMLMVGQKWKRTWDSLNKHHMSNEDALRRERIRKIHVTFENIQKLFINECHQKIEIKDWDSFEDFAVVWDNVVSCINNKWFKNTNCRLTATVRLDKCVSCKSPTDNHKISCKCVTCLIAGPYFSNANEDIIRSLCYQCAVMQKAVQTSPQPPILLKKLKNILKENCAENILIQSNEITLYHVSWIVFHNLEGRRKYVQDSIIPDIFCENCDKVECSIARTIINKEIHFEFATLAAMCYRPLLLSQTEVKANIPHVLQFLQDLLTMNITTLFDINDPFLKIIITFCCSVLISFLGNFNTRTDKINLENLQLSEGDIKLKDGHHESLSWTQTLNYILNFNGSFHNVLNAMKQECRQSGDIQINVNMSSLCSREEKKIHSFEEQKHVHQSELAICYDVSQENLSAIEKMEKIPHDNYLAASPNSTRNEFGGPGKSKKRFKSGQCLDTWVKETLNYIEGDKKEKLTNKKLEKRNRQKLKKEEVKRIEELYTLKSQYQDLYYKEYYAKQELKTYKYAKKKNKKKIIEKEISIKKLNIAKLKIERNILESLHIIKSINSNFKLTYLPSKEDLEHASRSAHWENDLQVAEKSIDTKNCSSISKDIISSVSNQQEDNKNFDTSKKIVTIRRVNVPYLTEPQVTVTAKGKSPKEDKLLYTFINGQIIPASSLDTQMLNILTNQSLSVLPKDTKLTEIDGVSVPENMKINKFSKQDISKIAPSTDNSNITNLTDTQNATLFSKERKIHAESNFRNFMKTSIEKTTIKQSHEEEPTQRLCESLRNLNLGENLVSKLKSSKEKGNHSYVHVNVSIMDQINNGIQVENLTLPPGITLTKVDPLKADKLKSKRESIEMLSYRMHASDYRASNTDNQPINLQIVKECTNSEEYGEVQLEQKSYILDGRKKRKHKYPINKINEKKECNVKTVHLEKMYPRIIQENLSLSFPCENMEIKIPIDQTAAIIKKENGMFTIRSPTVYPEALSSSTNMLSSVLFKK